MAILDPSYRAPTLTTTLAIDALYFRTAREAYARAKAATKYITRAEATVAKLQFKIGSIYEPDDVDERGEPYVDVGGKYYEQLEQLAIQIESAEYTLGETHGPFLQWLATAHILCTASLEAHINVRAQGLQGRLKDAFERLALDTKWLFLPKVLGLGGFDPGGEPFQSFDHLVRTRNKLVHYKVHREPWRSPGVPEFLDHLGLSLEAAERSLGAVTGMVSDLATQLKEDAPSWLTADKTNFFEIELVPDAK